MIFDITNKAEQISEKRNGPSVGNNNNNKMLLSNDLGSVLRECSYNQLWFSFLYNLSLSVAPVSFDGIDIRIHI